ncbi:MAG TPA: asparagine synthase C-terminal domain-containing protein [Rhodanobacteraceae bacterium]|nr:asparagine synthase C-terminal domain-containing protein [Rhodanobacteraceae bacterium]
MSEPRPAADDLTGDFLFAIGPEADAGLFRADGFTLVASGSNAVAWTRGRVASGTAADGTHWLGMADVAANIADGVGAFTSAIPPQAAWRGRFVQVLWRADEGRAIALTDHFSTLSLFALEHGATLYLASDLRLLASLPACTREVDPVAVYHYLNLGCVPAPVSICRGIRRVEPGTRLVFDRGRVKSDRWFVPEYPEDFDGDEATLTKALQDRIVASVRDYRPSDANAWGCFLSGGTDSSSVVSILSRENKGTVRAFSIGFAEEGYDELGFAKIAADACGAESITARVSRTQTIDLLHRVVAAYDEPFGNASAVPTLGCADLAADNGGTRVMVAGDGGDEIFGGNERYAKDHVMETYYRLPGAIKAIGSAVGRAVHGSKSHFLNRVENFFERASLPNPDRFYTDDSFASDHYEELLTPAFRKSVPRDASLDWMRHVYALGRDAAPLHRIMRLDLMNAIAQNDLVKVHGACKSRGISVRFPFLDPEIVAFTGRLPARYKVRGTDKRYLFKRAMAGILPEATIRKKKQGFGLPTAVWLRHDKEFQSMVRDVLFDQRARERGWFEPKFIDKLIAEHIEGSWDYSSEIWRLLVLELWLRKHLDGR